MSILTEREIKNCCFLSSSFSKAKGIYCQNDINSISLKKQAKDTIVAEAEVKGNTKPEYKVEIEFVFQQKGANKKAKVNRCSCECEAYAKYRGFCKHIAATVLLLNHKYKDDTVKDILENCAIGYQLSYGKKELYGKDTDLEENVNQARERKTLKSFGIDSFGENSGEDRGFMYNAASNMLELSKGVTRKSWMRYSDLPVEEFGYKREYEPKSSGKLLDMMSRIELRQRNEYCRDITRGDVQLEILLNLDYKNPQIEFRIGNKRMYVIKDAKLLLDNIKNQQFYRYGKQLEFAHNQSAFTRESLDLISLLFNDVLQDYETGYDGVGDRKSITLTPKMTDALFRGFAGKKIKLCGALGEKTEKLEVVEENPKLKLFIDGIDGGNKAVLTFKEIMLIEGVDTYYVVGNDKIYICSREYCNDMGSILKLMKKKKKSGYRYYYYEEDDDEQLEIVRSDYTYFSATLLPILKKYMKVTIKGIDFEEYRMTEGQYEVYFELANGRDIICNAKVIYGEAEHNLLTIADMKESYRDIRLEHELRTMLKAYLPEISEDGEYFILRDDDEKLAMLIEFGMEQIKEIADVFVSEDFKKIKIANHVKIKTGLSIHGNLLNVSWDVEGMSDEELYEILHSYYKKKKYFRLKTGELLNIRQSGIDVLAKIYENLKLDKSALSEGMAEVPAYRSLYIDSLVEENREKLTLEKSEQFKKFIDKFGETKNKKYVLPDNVKVELRKYQMEGYRWACSLAEFGFGGILADDMGLGKTLQMISYLCSVKGKTHIVICPASLVYNWEAEFLKFTRDCSVGVIVGDAVQRAALIAEYEKYDVIITSYDLLKRDISQYADKEFGCEIIDEAQYIKNHLTQASKAVRAIKSDVRFALTGTPIENRVSELWSIFDYLMPGYLYSYNFFRKKFEEDIMNQPEDEAVVMLHKMINPFILRRLKKDVLKELPDKVEKVVYTKFDTEQENLYRATEKNILMSIGKKSDEEFTDNKLQILAELTKLRQICCDPSLLYENYSGGSAKLEACIELVESAIDSGHKILLFSQFTTMLGLILQRLKQRKIRTFMLTGSTSKVARRDLVERFQKGEADVFLISLKAGGTGLNLTSADMVIHYDPWWNVAAQNQATDRAHRIGQENKVTVVKLIAHDSIEERILKLQNMKRELADKIISGENVSMASLTKEDLLELFSK